MARLNLRLTCSLLAVGAVLVLAFWPGTRTLVQRQFWIISQRYEDRVGRDPALYVQTNGMIDDQRVFVLLTGYNQIPVDSRAVELMKIAAARKAPALWAHTIRQTTMVPVPISNPNKFTPVDEAQDLRVESLGKIQLVAAQAGEKLDPENVFFDLAEATAWAKLKRWDKVSPVLAKAGHKTKYDDYVFDEFERRAKALKYRLGTVLESDLGDEWASILLPHLANFKALFRGLDNITNPRDRFAAGLGLAQIGRVMEKTKGSDITNLVGSSLVLGSGRALIGLKEKYTEKDLQPILGQIVERAKKLGANDIAAGWQSFSGWKRSEIRDYSGTDLPTEAETLIGVKGLYLLALCAGLATAIWLGTHIEPSAKNVTMLGCILLGTELLCALPLEQFGLVLALLIASNLLFVGFLLVRLPGKDKIGYALAGTALLMSLAASAFTARMEFFAGLVVAWGIPFALARWLRPSVPKWLGVVIATLFFGFIGVFIFDGMRSDPLLFSRGLVESSTTLMALAAFLVPILMAAIMSLTKTNLPDTLKLIAWPFPMLALCAAGVFVWGTREMVHREKVWREISRETLPQKYQTLINEIRAEDSPEPSAEVEAPQVEKTAPPVAPTAKG